MWSEDGVEDYHRVKSGGIEGLKSEVRKQKNKESEDVRDLHRRFSSAASKDSPPIDNIHHGYCLQHSVIMM